MPVIAEITGAVALTALIMGPWWSRVEPPAPRPLPASPAPPAPPVSAASSASLVSPASTRAAHLNLDVRHSFASVVLLVTVDGKQALRTTLAGSGKKFKMFGRRNERTFMRTLELQPGVRLVRVRIQSPGDQFDQTRVERFELASASVASLRITADKEAGLVASTDRSTIIERSGPAPIAAPASPQPTVAAAIPLPAAAPPATPASSVARDADALRGLLNSLRSILIAIAGFVATTSAGFVLEQFLNAKKRALIDARRPAQDIASAP